MGSLCLLKTHNLLKIRLNPFSSGLCDPYSGWSRDVVRGRRGSAGWPHHVVRGITCFQFNVDLNR